MIARQRLLVALLSLTGACGGAVAGTTESTDSGSGDALVLDSATTTTPVSDSGAMSETTTSDVSVGECIPGMCVLVPKTCCGLCGTATPTDELALPRDEASPYRSKVCAGEACPGCVTAQDANLEAFCIDHKCVAVDLRTIDISSCSSDGDCSVEWAKCCGKCAPSDLVAVATSKRGELLGQLCDPRVDCTVMCGSVPPDVYTRCEPTTHHCILIRPK